MAFKPRNYNTQKEAHALPLVRTDSHPLSAPPSHHRQVDVVDHEHNDFFDPLRGLADNATNCREDVQELESTSSEASSQLPTKEWMSFKRFLMQKFPVSKMVSISSMSNVIMKGVKVAEKSLTSTHLEELEDPEKCAEDGVKVVTRQEYISRLHELKDEINRAWRANDRVTSLKLAIKVARLLMDTSVLHFYPTLFVLSMDIMDMLGDMVWERIKWKAEFAEDGTRLFSLPENFQASDICSDAKETCNNWFCKIGSICELLPRIYLELALLPCWCFLVDQPEDSLQRLVMMTRGLSDPLASAYCRLYMAHCAQKLPRSDTGYLVKCVNDINIQLMRIISAREMTHRNSTDNKRLLFTLIEPTIEYIMKSIFKDASKSQVSNVLVELGSRRNQVELFGSLQCISMVLHHLLKELPAEVVTSNAMEILHTIECSNDYSYDQCLNYRLLGLRLSERRSQMEIIHDVVDKVIQVLSQNNSLDEYLKVVDAYVDIVLQNQMDNHLNTILGGILNRACNKGVAEDELASLQTILMKLLNHFKGLEDVFALNHFLEILDIMHGNSQSFVNMHILNLATRNSPISDPTTIQLLFEISQALHDDLDFVNAKDDDNQPARLISRFVHMETLVHSSNCLAIKALKDAKKHLSFIKSCIAFGEVTLPSISAQIKQLNLYLETAEVALVCGLVSHSDGLIDSAISCLLSLDFVDGSRTSTDIEGILSAIRKLFCLLIMVPGNPEKGVTYFANNILALVNSSSWMTPAMRTRIFCTTLTLTATLSQNKLPYHAVHGQIFGNDLLFFGDSSYLHELVSLSEFVLQNLVDSIQKEPSPAARGCIALEACNCIASSFVVSPEISQICSKLIETAKSCLSASDKYLQSTIKFLDKNVRATVVAVSSVSV
ncbi:VPS35 endosomal protein-sorting factor-like isoform X3 [Juglans microcarpa x Juglans regia]|uniref:VPS35 endosomal protein-sorting factor-like isoform X3 n=1 Tax=Juglans microcarpa x Juglans regia TaxID=2249226 RepID=UPI001B7F385B|nr:VPS35 endosomal protein-sorting factor-like isoform X3 [Juglans microcarpa x Juglans regia]